MSATVTPLADALGAEVHGIALAALNDADFRVIRSLLRRYLVCLFPGQSLTAQDQRALGQRFGHVQTHAYHADLDGPVPEMLVMRATRPVAAFWHVDETYEDNPPAWSILRMVECPPTGGDTLWSNQYLSYQSLPDNLKKLLQGKSARHVTPDADRWATHPMTLLHPNTARQALYVNRQFTRQVIGMGQHESTSLLDELFSIAEAPRFQIRYQWSPGTVAIWDNRCTQHRVVGDYNTMRHAERIAVA